MAEISHSRPASMPAHRRTLELALDPASLPADISISVLLEEVRAIWTPYVDVSVTMRPGPPCFACRYRLDVRVADAPADGGHESLALGWIDFVDGEPQPVVSVSVAQARRLVEHVEWNGRPFKTLPAGIQTRLLSVALGRAVAHEIGHYLLRSRAHAPSGLMRASYTAFDAKDPNSKHFTLTSREISKLSVTGGRAFTRPGESGVRPADLQSIPF